MALKFNPIMRKRYLRFKKTRRAYFALWLLALFYFVSLGAELICNSEPLYVRFNGRSYFPAFKFYAEGVFTGSSQKTRPNYKQLNQTDRFKNNPKNFMWFAPIPYGPNESVDPSSIRISDTVTAVLTPMPMVGSVNISPDYGIKRSVAFAYFMGRKDEKDVAGHILSQYFDLPPEIRRAVADRFQNRASPFVSCPVRSRGGLKVVISLSGFRPRRKSPQTVRLLFTEAPDNLSVQKLVFNKTLGLEGQKNGLWNGLSESNKNFIRESVQKRFTGPVDKAVLRLHGRSFQLTLDRQDVRFPFPPTAQHVFGIDGAGRDVMARIVYGFRTSVSFGLTLVVCSMAMGILAGAVQGYFGGMIDMSGQRLIEIWSALPFLYVMILMGSTFGRSFFLLLFCYGIFNWIGISYYMRAEFLRLRRQPFVEAGICMGVRSYKIILRHILPNALVPVVTFFPFSLVGAIGSLAALDFLGFGLPPPTPSWGELLFQAQQYRWAWWLILYPSSALFFVMLLCVFVGEGIRNAYDPKRFSRLE